MLRVHAEKVIQEGNGNCIDADQWRPLMSFQHFYEEFMGMKT